MTMAKKRKTPLVVWLRRFTQSAFFVLFIYLFLETTDHPINRAGRQVTLFFDLDPLVALNSLLATHKVERAMLLSLATLAVTVLCGRWFCGWVCPFGATHNFFTYLRSGRAKPKLEVGGYSRWQTAKYYILVAFLVAAFLGANVAGWLDPFSFFFRSLTTSIYPAVNSAIVSLFTWTYDVNPGVGPVRLSIVTEPIYSFSADSLPGGRAALLLGQSADRRAVDRYRGAELLSRPVLVPLYLSFGRVAGRRGQESAGPLAEERRSVHQLPPVPS